MVRRTFKHKREKLSDINRFAPRLDFALFYVKLYLTQDSQGMDLVGGLRSTPPQRHIIGIS